MRYIYAIIFLFTLLIAPTQERLNAQSSVRPNLANHAIVFEGLGHGFLYSLNYERTLLKSWRWRTTAQIGLSYYGESSGLIPLWVPVSINQSYRFYRLHHVEIGMGKMLNDDGVQLSDQVYRNKYRFDDWIFRLGYRYHTRDGRWLFKIAYTPIYQDKFDFISWGGVAIGRRF